MKNLITYIVIILSLGMMITGCLSERQAARRLYTIHAKHPQIVTKHCADIFPDQSYLVDSVIFLPGVETTVIDTVLVSDTITRFLTKTIYRNDKRVDTIYRLKNLKIVNKAKELQLQNENLALSVSFGKLQKERNILSWLTIVLGAYTVIRWVLRFWNIRLP
ncbi:MAG TPA: hypothetical protein VK167_11640 [Flavipsychrobacter sp.]|nr:hypothetical protein [Flavipsychrobacter sp.]